MVRRRRPPRRWRVWVGAGVAAAVTAGFGWVVSGAGGVDDSIADKTIVDVSIFPSVQSHPELTWKPKASPTGKPSPSQLATPSAASPKPTPTPSSSSAKPPKSSTPKPSPTASVTSKPPRPATPPSSAPAVTPPTTPAPTANTTTWYTSGAAVAAAQRMQSAGVPGDPACSLSAVGEPDPSQIPAGLSQVGVGEVGGYWCLRW